MVLALLVFSIFAYLYFGSKKKAQIEQDKVPLLQEQCGGRFDSLNLTIPFVRHAIYEDFIIIAYGHKKIVIKYKELKNVVFSKFIISKGISYLHSNPELPSSIIVWTLSYDKALRILRQKNVRIEV